MTSIETVDRKLKRETQDALFDLRGCYPLHVIATACDVPLCTILAAINGHVLKDSLWLSMAKGVNILKKETVKNETHGQSV